MRCHHAVPLTLLLVLCAVAVSAEVLPHTNCPGVSTCDVHELRVNGCRRIVKGVCQLRRGSTPEISFDYTPAFEASSLHGQVYWVSPGGDLPFLGMETNACLHTTCPLQSGVKQSYAYNLETSRKYTAVSVCVCVRVGGVVGVAIFTGCACICSHFRNNTTSSGCSPIRRRRTSAAS